MKREELFRKGPSIHVTFHIEEKLLQRVDLTPSSEDGLSCTFVGQSFPKLEEALKKWLQGYSEGVLFLPPFSLRLDGFSSYTSQVLSTLQTIPFGEHRSYRDIAQLTGSPRAARAVGNACSQNPYPLVIPCHRVITSQGSLGGFTGGLEVKRRLLHFENIAYK